MLHHFKNFLRTIKETVFTGDKQQFDAQDPRVAACVLLLYVIEADGTRDAAEKQQLIKIIQMSYDLDDDRVQILLDQAKKAHHESVDLYQYTSILKNRFNEKQKRGFVAALLTMAFADGHLQEHEDNIVWRIAGLLGVSNQDFALLRSEAAGSNDREKIRD